VSQDIYKVLEDHAARVTCGYRWLVMDLGEYTVYERRPYAKVTKMVYIGTDENAACLALIDADGE